MVRLRNAVMAVALGTGVMGCTLSGSQTRIAHYSIWHCDECDDFPTPAYGPGYSMMPGSYTRPPAQGSVEPKQPANGATDSGSVAPPAATARFTPPPAKRRHRRLLLPHPVWVRRDAGRPPVGRAAKIR